MAKIPAVAIAPVVKNLTDARAAAQAARDKFATITTPQDAENVYFDVFLKGVGDKADRGAIGLETLRPQHTRFAEGLLFTARDLIARADRPFADGFTKPTDPFTPEQRADFTMLFDTVERDATRALKLLAQ